MSLTAGKAILLSSAAGGGYEVSRSLRFNSSDSAFLSRAVSTAGNRKTFTFACWVKLSSLSALGQFIFTTSPSSASDAGYLYYSNNQFIYWDRRQSADQTILATNAVYRDPSAWCHVVLSVNYSAATSTDRAKIYVNGIEQTYSTATYPSTTESSYFNVATTHYISAPGGYVNAYLADIHFIDGQALTPSSFTEVSATTGQLIPKAYSGSFGTNGFWLKFSDNSATTATTLGKDYSGNGNNWTPNNFSVSEGITSVAAATGALPIYNTTDTYGTVKGSGTRTDSFSSSLVLALAMDGANNGTTFTDLSATIKGSGSAKSITVNGTAKTVTSDSKFYGSSAYFDGSTASLSIPDSADWAFGSGEFCIEFWAKGSLGILSFGQGEGGSPAFSVPYGEWYVGPSIWSFTFSIGTALPNNRWYHYAVVRSGNTINFYIDGIRYGSHSYSSSWPDSSSDFTIGLTRGIGFPVYVQDFRVYKGTAKYTANFNPPSATQIPAVAVGIDSLVDTPTSAGTDTGVGGQVTGNYCTWNPINSKLLTGSVANGNLDFTGPAGDASYNFIGGTIGFGTDTSTGIYFEVTQATYGQFAAVSLLDQGVFAGNLSSANPIGLTANASSGISYNNQGSLINYGAATTGLTSWTSNGDVIGVAIKDNKIWFAKNNTWISGSPSAGTSPSITLASTKYVTPAATGINSSVFSLNAGQRPWAYAAPSGFRPLVDTLLPAPVVAKPSTVFDAKLYTGTGAAQTVSGLGFSPDLVWIKKRSASGGHILNNSVVGTGTGKALYSNTTDAAGGNDVYGYLSALTSDGFTTQGGTDPSFPYDLVGANSATYVAWCFDAGSNTVSNTQGSITTSVRASASSGFAVITGSTPSSNVNFSFGHNLGIAPSLVIYKHTAVSGNWQVYHRNGGGNNYNLNSTAGPANSGTWSGLDPTSTLITIPSTIISANSSAFVCYAWAPVAGYSSFGSYTGNGSADGPFVYTGFRPRWILIKSATETAGWMIYDTARDTYNQSITLLYPNLSLAEQSSSNYAYDIVSNGFKVRNSGQNNTSSQTYIYAAFAESPFQYARAR